MKQREEPNGQAMKQYMQEKWKANIEAEKRVISFLLQNPYAIARIVDMLQPDHFSRDAHIEIYKAMTALYLQNRNWDYESVIDELERSSKLEHCGGEAYLMDLISDYSAGDIEEYAGIVIRKASMRKLLYASQQIAQMALAEDENALEQAQQLVYEIAIGAGTKPEKTFAEAIDEYLADLTQRKQDAENNIAHGLSTSYYELDKLTGGLQPAALYTLGALTGFGKSALALNMALNIALKTKHVLFFSLEMRVQEIVQRALSIQAEVDNATLRDATLDEVSMRAIAATARRLKDCDIKVDDSSYSINAIKSKAKRIHGRKRLDLIVVDYIQLIENMETKKGRTRAEEVSDLSRSLKRLAQELDIPILCLVQLNRELEKRQEEPKLAHINESGGIARDSDVVMFMYATQEEIEKREACQPYTIWLKVAKGRNARLGQVPLKFNPRITKFREEVIDYVDD